MFSDKRIFHETQPFRNNDALRLYVKNPYNVNYLIHPLTSRCAARKFGDHYLNLEELEQHCAKELNETSRPKVLVVSEILQLTNVINCIQRKFDVITLKFFL